MQLRLFGPEGSDKLPPPEKPTEIEDAAWRPVQPAIERLRHHLHELPSRHAVDAAALLDEYEHRGRLTRRIDAKARELLQLARGRRERFPELARRAPTVHVLADYAREPRPPVEGGAGLVAIPLWRHVGLVSFLVEVFFKAPVGSRVDALEAEFSRLVPIRRRSGLAPEAIAREISDLRRAVAAEIHLRDMPDLDEVQQ